jgi:hypothetical protein
MIPWIKFPFIFKAFLCLINILSSFTGVYEILFDAVSTPRNKYTVREIPNGLISLMERVVFINSDAKIQSLFNYEQSHTFGLRLLSYLQSDLDIHLLLEVQYGYNQMLLESQKSNQQDTDVNSSPVIIDILSIERNYVLVQSNLIGGPKEKLIPARLIHNKSNLQKCPMFHALPVPAFYYKIEQIKPNPNDSFKSELFKKSEPIDEKWLQKCRKMYTAALKKGNLVYDLLSDLLKNTLEVLCKLESNILFGANEFSLEPSLVTQVGLSSLQLLGIDKTVQYGIQINQLKKDLESQHTSSLTSLMKAVKNMLKQKKIPKTKLNYVQESYPGYDWFSASVFLMFNGHFDASWKFLSQFQKIYHSAFLWHSRLYMHVDIISPNLVNNGINTTLGTICHYIEYIMKIELPLVFSAFRMSGFPASQVPQNVRPFLSLV